MSHSLHRVRCTALLLPLLLATCAVTLRADSVVGDFIITYQDSSGFFSDPANGAARTASLDYALSTWDAWLPANDNEPIRILVETPTTPPGLSSWGNILGYNQTSSFWSGFSGAPHANVWYPGALADYLAKTDLYYDYYHTYTNDYDMVVGIDPYASWYLPTTGSPGSSMDLASVLLHEIGHGLGFTGLISYQNSAWQWNYDGDWAIYDTFLSEKIGNTYVSLTSMTPTQRAAAVTSDALYWTGADAEAANGGKPVQVYAPTTYAGGSSIYHLDYAANDAQTGDQPSYYLMSPFRAPGQVDHTISAVETGMLDDMGWNGGIAPTPEPVAIILLLASPPMGLFFRRRRRR